MKKKRFLWYLGGLVALVFGIVLDQWTKFLATTYLKGKEDIVLIKNVFCLHYLENRGAAFRNFSRTKNIFYYYHLAVTFRSTLLLYPIAIYKAFCCVSHLHGSCGGWWNRKYDR